MPVLFINSLVAAAGSFHSIVNGSWMEQRDLAYLRMHKQNIIECLNKIHTETPGVILR